MKKDFLTTNYACNTYDIRRFVGGIASHQFHVKNDFWFFELLFLEDENMMDVFL